MADSVLYPQSLQQQATDEICQSCRQPAATRHVTLGSNIGLVIMRFPSSVSGRMCKNCIDHYFWKFTLTTLFLGWWGILSFFHTLYLLPSNVITFASTRSLPRPPRRDSIGP
jgi:hypothetical protein